MVKKAHPAVARDRFARRAARWGSPLRQSQRGTPPVATWRAACRCLILSVYLTPDGWALDGRDFKLSTPDWIKRQRERGVTEIDGVELTLENYRTGRYAAFGTGEVSGFAHLLPLDLAEWEVGERRFEVGCPHGYGHFPLAEVHSACGEVRATRTTVARRFNLGAVT
ncbi:hypothetical protein GCM10027425_33870 [Alteromonas gracilis]